MRSPAGRPGGRPGTAMMGKATEVRQRARSPQGEGPRLRQELMEAADRLLARTGDEAGLTLRAVAREAGVAAPSVYLHFASKQELLRAVKLEHFAEFGRALETAAAAAEGPAAKLRAGCLAYCRFAVEQPGAYRAMFGNTSSGFADEGWEEVPGADTFAILTGAIAANMASGTALPGDPQHVATLVWAALHGIVSLRLTVPMFPWPPVEELVDAVLVGLVGLHEPDAARALSTGTGNGAEGRAGGEAVP